MQIETKNKLRYQYLDKTDLKITLLRDREGHYIMIKGLIQQEDRTLVNIYAANIGAPKYVKHILMDIKGKTESHTVIVGDFNIPLTSMARSSRQKNQRENSDLN